jgi:hypothetical protein
MVKDSLSSLKIMSGRKAITQLSIIQTILQLLPYAANVDTKETS